MKVLNLTVEYEEISWTKHSEHAGEIVVRLNSAEVYRWPVTRKPYEDELDRFVAEKLSLLLTEGASTP